MEYILSQCVGFINGPFHANRSGIKALRKKIAEELSSMKVEVRK